MASTWVYLIRHGEVEEAAQKRFFGHTDVALSPTGLRQVEALGRHLGREVIEAVYTSDLRRARQSGEPVAAARELVPLADAALREVAMGRWEGLTFQEIRARDPKLIAAWLADPAEVAFPEGESLVELGARVMPALRTILDRHAGGRVAVVAHGGTNRVILAEALGLRLANSLRIAQDYACVNLIEYRRSSAVVHALNQLVAGVAAVPPVETSAQEASRP